MTRFSLLTGVIALTLLLAAPTTARAERVDCEAVHSQVDAEITAACPCDGFPSHGKYVRCIARTLRTMAKCQTGNDGDRECGPVPQKCVGKIRRVASRSTCGRGDAVTCCLSRQHDCRGDATPGDGNKQGLCSGTSKPCDTLSDCLSLQRQPLQLFAGPAQARPASIPFEDRKCGIEAHDPIPGVEVGKSYIRSPARPFVSCQAALQGDVGQVEFASIGLYFALEGSQGGVEPTQLRRGLESLTHHEVAKDFKGAGIVNVRANLFKAEDQVRILQSHFEGQEPLIQRPVQHPVHCDLRLTPQGAGVDDIDLIAGNLAFPAEHFLTSGRPDLDPGASQLQV